MDSEANYSSMGKSHTVFSGNGMRRTRTKKDKQGDEQDPNQAGRMLKTEEIREICDKHQLTRMEVYNIRSQFAGMV